MKRFEEKNQPGGRTAEKAKLFRSVLHDSHFGGQVEIVEAVPQGDRPKAALPIYYAHGAGWAQEKPTVEEIARQGRSAFYMDFVGGRKPADRYVVGNRQSAKGNVLHHMSEKEVTRLGELGVIVPQQQIRAAASLLGVIAERSAEDRGAGRVDALLQSESAGHGLIAAYAAPEKFRNIVLAYPGGLSGKRKGFIPGRIVRDTFARRKHRPAPDNDFRYPDRLKGLQSIRMQLKAPGFHEDAKALRHGHLPQMLHSLRQKPHAPGVTLVIGLHDGIFRLKDYFRNLVSATDVDRIVIIPGGHAIGGRKDVLAKILEQLAADDHAKSEAAQKPLRERIVFPLEVSPRTVEKIYKLADAVDRRTQ